MMGKLRFLSPGVLTLLQDAGRPGLGYYGIPASGPLDRRSARLANLIVGRAEDAAVIEMNLLPPQIKFLSSATVALTGADMQWNVDGASVDVNETLTLRRGAVLSGTAPRLGLRSYLAIAGTIQAGESFGSVSGFTPAGFGANNGNPFAAGDLLEWAQEHDPERLRIDLVDRHLTTQNIHIFGGPEFDQLTAEAMVQLSTQQFSISPQSNRMGARLIGPKLSVREGLTNSRPVLPGMIQLTPAGDLIVALQDGQTTGGYPRIGYIETNELDRFNQIAPGKPFRISCERQS
jgi:biotin-dependent carboxylase-like uncharacterized protein